MLVYPATLDLPGFMPPMGMLPGGDAMRRRTHYITPNVSTVRDYVPGDSFNRIPVSYTHLDVYKRQLWNE